MEFSVNVQDLKTVVEETQLDKRVPSDEMQHAVMLEALQRHKTEHDFSKGAIQLTPVDNPLKTIDPLYNEKQSSTTTYAFGCNCGELLLARMFGKKLEANGRAFKDEYETPTEVKEYTGSSVTVTSNYSSSASYGGVL